MKKELIFIDLDNTLVKGYTQSYFVKYLFKNKKINLANSLLLFFWFFLYKIKIIKNADSIIRFYVKFVKGMTEGEIKNIGNNIFYNDIKDKIYKDFFTIIDNYKKNNCAIFIVSASLDFIVEKISNELGINNFIATKLSYENGIATGKLVGDVMEGKCKLQAVKNIINSREKYIIHFFSDHISDLSLLEYADLAHVVNPDKMLYNIAKNNNWDILELKQK